ncbi:MAG: hypothetical protein JW761_08180, partial [Prolixibacteraceae bacterium]|nr:hypothetical protein [Prolixibacteraceae bacterium]
MKKFISTSFILVLFILLFSACDIVNNDDDKPADQFLTDYEMVKSYLPELIKLAFDQVPGDYPELDAIKEKVQHGVLVYRITYNTAFEGKLQAASGLVCIPTGDGPFPMMSYQNGT